VLPVDAIRSVAAAPIGAHAVFADAIDVRAVTFFENIGFLGSRVANLDTMVEFMVYIYP
jgi:hypothetical protein